MLIELHLLQNFAPSCLNRDDTNAPKDCLFGGVRRARISSQCLKRAIRWHPEFLARTAAGSVRTKRLAEHMGERLSHLGAPPEATQRFAPAVVQELVGRLDPRQRTRALTHLGCDEVERLTQLLAAAPRVAAATPAGARRKRVAGSRRVPLRQLAREVAGQFEPGTDAADVALFGRMIAENAHFNVSAACQVAHAISTHRAVMEIDFFSAVDDLKPGDAPGVEMLGAIEFNSACFYRYAAVSVEQLLANLRGETALAAGALAGFLRAAIAAVPPGRQHSMAAASPPSFVMAVVRQGGGGWSLVNAFERPVFVSGQDRLGLVGKSIIAADAYWGRLATMYGEEDIMARPACWLDDCSVRHLRGQRVRRVHEVVDTALAAAGLPEG